MGAIGDLERRYSHLAAVYIVYTREAHPADGWRLASNDEHEVCVPAARSLEERAHAAEDMCRRYEVDLPVLVDSMNDAASEAFAAYPDRVYLIDRDGRVAHKGGRGPYGFDIDRLERALLLALVDEDDAPRVGLGGGAGGIAPR